MKTICRSILLSIAVCIMLAGCTRDRDLKPDTPENLAMLVKFAMFTEDYTRFQSLWSEGRKEAMNEQDFMELKSSVYASGASLGTYSYLKFENGEMLLLDIVRDNKGNYKIQNIIHVPASLSEKFN